MEIAHMTLQVRLAKINYFVTLVVYLYKKKKTIYIVLGCTDYLKIISNLYP